MATAMIEVDERVAAALRAQAQSRDLPLSEFLHHLAAGATPLNSPALLSDAEWHQALDEVSSDLPVLPADFSRADIYLDHD